jgi:hypothetical protein
MVIPFPFLYLEENHLSGGFATQGWALPQGGQFFIACFAAA